MSAGAHEMGQHEVEVRVTGARLAVLSFAAVLGIVAVIVLAIAFIRTGSVAIGTGFLIMTLGTAVELIILAADVDAWLRSRGW